MLQIVERGGEKRNMQQVCSLSAAYRFIHAALRNPDNDTIFGNVRSPGSVLFPQDVLKKLHANDVST